MNTIESIYGSVKSQDHNLVNSRLNITSELIQTQNNLTHDLRNQTITIPNRNGNHFSTIKVDGLNLKFPRTSYESMFLEQLQTPSSGALITPLKLFYKGSGTFGKPTPVLAPISSISTPIISQYSPSSFTNSFETKNYKPDRIPNFLKSVYDAPEIPSSWIIHNDSETVSHAEDSTKVKTRIIGDPINSLISTPAAINFSMTTFKIPSAFRLDYGDKRKTMDHQDKDLNSFTDSLVFSKVESKAARESGIHKPKSRKNSKKEFSSTLIPKGKGKAQKNDLISSSHPTSERKGLTKMCGPRSKSGCWTCRLRRKRCPEQRPACGECERLGLECDGYGVERPEFMKNDALAKEKMESIKAVTKFIKKRKKNDEYSKDKPVTDDE